MTTMIFYDKIVPLDRDQHRSLRLSTKDSKASFAAGTHYVPLSGSEFSHAARDFPILFANEANGGPVALLGLQKESNLFIEGDGSWATGVYVPAFVRRYPFILAQGQEAGETTRTVCIDENFAGFGDQEGTRLFDENGHDSDYLTSIVDFLNQFTTDLEMTREFLQHLNELDLLGNRTLRVTDAKGREFTLSDFRIVDEDKLAVLDDSVLGDLNRRGWLGWIYAHLVSLGNVYRMPMRLDAGASS